MCTGNEMKCLNYAIAYCLIFQAEPVKTINYSIEIKLCLFIDKSFKNYDKL